MAFTLNFPVLTQKATDFVGLRKQSSYGMQLMTPHNSK